MPRALPRLVVMVKVPEAGRVKTRLARGVGSARATAFYRNTCAAVLARLVQPGRWRTELAIAPDSGVASRAFPRAIRRGPQGGGDLGQRMQRLLDAPPAGPVVVVGTDIPAIRPAHIAAAFRRLAGADVVLGAAEDGGFWLVGASRLRARRRFFAGVRWSAPETLLDTLANLAGLRVARAATLHDVDTPAELAAVPWHGRRVLPAGVR